MRTIAEWRQWLAGRASRDDGCLVWKLCKRSGVPQANWINPQSGKKETINVRRMVFEAREGRPAHKNACVVCKHGNGGCVEPSHLIEVTRGEMARGRKLSAAARARMTAAARTRKNIKLTQEQVRAIRYSSEPSHVVAERFGVSKSHVCGIRSNKWCREAGDPFAGLGARAA
ncbi:hypothetical protein GCM10028796_17300 [Ramlibacter monticola]|uniref:Uncharacterized protein n=1 Tax=Ramlibacter monticola TaxID=1926872 RepID=A0A937CRZ0_9BURK|nr:hypothetical protein [Ramlibacter monticola]MBL0390556.1 hypothetical protein [Ramlibacter monticola]